MAIWYFDTTMADDSGDGHSPETAKKSYDAFRIGGGGANGDTYLLKRGQTHILSSANVDFRSGVSTTSRTIIGAYGTANVPYAKITPHPTDTLNQDFIVNVSARSNIDISDIYFDGLGRVTYTMYILASGASANTGHRISRCYFTGTKAGVGAGLYIGGTSTSTGDTSDYIIEDCKFFDNPTHGLIVNSGHGITVRRCEFYGNGFDAPFGGHGFTNKYRLTDAFGSGQIASWTATGLVWARTLAAYELDVYYVKSSVGGYKRLNRTAGTQSTPAAGEFGVTGGVLYINVNSVINPANQSLQYAWGRCYDLTVEECVSHHNISDPDAAFLEGHGFAFDNWTDDSVFRRNVSYSNEGSGFSVNLGDRNRIENNVAFNNGSSGLSMAAAYGTFVEHNTFFDNNQGPTGRRTSGEITVFPDCKNGTIRRNILRHIGDGYWGIELYANVTGFSGDKNCIHGYSAAEKGIVFTSTILTNPLLDSKYRPHNASLKRTAGTGSGRDFYGKNRYLAATNIGAVEDLSTSARYVLRKAA